MRLSSVTARFLTLEEASWTMGVPCPGRTESKFNSLNLMTERLASDGFIEVDSTGSRTSPLSQMTVSPENRAFNFEW